MNKLLVLDHSLFTISHVIILRDIRSTHGYYEDNPKLSPWPENETKLLYTISNIQQIDTTIVGRRTHNHSLVCLFPFTIQWIIQDICKGHQTGSPLRTSVLCSTTFSATFLNKNGGPCEKNNGHQTLVYLLHVMTSWKQCYNSWPLLWCHSVKSQQNTGDRGSNLSRYLSLPIFQVTFYLLSIASTYDHQHRSWSSSIVKRSVAVNAISLFAIWRYAN